jgi:hypothetical protein
MRRPTALLCLCLLAWGGPSVAQTTIHHCIGADGGPVFTDQPCASLHATPVRPANDSHGTRSTAQSAPVLCATNHQALQQDVIDAFANHDANRLAGLMLWNGLGRGTATADIRSLATLVQQPLLGLGSVPDEDIGRETPYPAQNSSSNAQRQPSTTAPPDQLIVRTLEHDGESTPALRFDIEQKAGCLWLRHAS